MSKRQLSRIFPGTVFQNRKFNRIKDQLLKENDRCVVCGGRDNLEPHHIIPCHVHDPIFFDKDNIRIICRTCHDIYHQNFAPINAETFKEFKNNYKLSKSRKKKLRKKNKKYKRKEYEPHPLYSKIRINDFTKKKPEKKKKPKRKRKRKRRKRRIRFNPIFLTEKLGTDYWNYLDKIEIEREVLGDCYENWRDCKGIAWAWK